MRRPSASYEVDEATAVRPALAAAAAPSSIGQREGVRTEMVVREIERSEKSGEEGEGCTIF